MLSKLDIDKELGKGINIYPFNSENIKENSINLSASKYAWSMKKGRVYIGEEGEVYSDNKSNSMKEIVISKGRTAVREINGDKYIILLPLSTTLVETKEVIAIDSYIGGTYHSKVGLVSLGVGHNGTMFGPNFCGHSLIAIHNVSDYPLKIKVDDTIVSVVFNYLKTPIDFPNATNNGHLEKMSRLGVILNPSDEEFLNKDWKKNIFEVREKMKQSGEFKVYKQDMRKRKLQSIYNYLNIRNSLILVMTLLIFIIIWYSCSYIDNQNNNSILTDRYWNVGFSGILVVILQVMIGMIKPQKK